jgi:hypothetical protein
MAADTLSGAPTLGQPFVGRMIIEAAGIGVKPRAPQDTG